MSAQPTPERRLARAGFTLTQFWADGAGREEGTRGILEKLGAFLASGY
ncbi:MAG TPA: hypothetical protein VFQ74_09755 [Pseudolysinimonas sp.]|nr:hypothetical protein [Pseudolysinimonas sp.]